MKYHKFDVYWWLRSDSDRLCRLATKQDTDIEQFSEHHFRIRAVPLEPEDGENLELIIMLRDGQWIVKSDSFEDASEEYPFDYIAAAETATWIDAQGDELMVIVASSDA